MLTFDVLREYIATRSSDRWLTSWLLSSAAAVTFVAATHANSFYALSRANGAESTSELGASAWDAHADVRHIKKICNRRSDTSNKSELSFSSRFHRFIYLLRIAVPSLRSKECALLVIIIVLLATKTFLSARFARFNAALIEVAIRCDLMETTRAVMSYILWQVPSTLAGSSLKYCTEILALQLQSNLGNYFHRIYLNDNAFFPVAGSNRIKNIDERLTRHITRWSATVTKLFISLVQPLTDVVLLSYKLSALTGTRLSMLAGAYFAGFSLIACSLTPDMEKLVGEQLRREGALVSAHDRVLTYAEEIVMTQGQRYHVHVLNHLLKSLLQHKRYATYIYSRYAFVEILCLKYGSRLLGYAICGAIVLSTRTAGMTTAQLAGLHVEVTLLFIALSRAISGVLRNFRTLSVLQALTEQVYELQDCTDRATSHNSTDTTVSRGEVVRGNHIEFERVPIVLPTNEVLCKQLSFYVKPGMNLLVVGPNGCGKSSMLRFLAGLWTIRDGRLTRPLSNRIYYIPQQSHMPSGTLRDQITYPHKFAELEVSESTLLSCLEMAMLDDILKKPNISWNSSLSWASDVLSLGERQKLAMARLFFHRPYFAVLDECTSNLDVETEERLYDTCRQLGISLITIAHRRSLWQHHNWILHFDGQGGYIFSPVVFREDGTARLTKVVAASDESLIGSEVCVNLCS